MRFEILDCLSTINIIFSENFKNLLLKCFGFCACHNILYVQSLFLLWIQGFQELWQIKVWRKWSSFMSQSLWVLATKFSSTEALKILFAYLKFEKCLVNFLMHNWGLGLFKLRKLIKRKWYTNKYYLTVNNINNYYCQIQFNIIFILVKKS